jgi:hypothetical protein
VVFDFHHFIGQSTPVDGGFEFAEALFGNNILTPFRKTSLGKQIEAKATEDQYQYNSDCRPTRGLA